MKTINTTPDIGANSSNRLQVYNGGLGSSSASEALANLNALSVDYLDKPNGAASKNSQGFLNPSLILGAETPVALSGVLSLDKSTSTTYSITNYDSNKLYTLTAVDGTVSRVGAIITYTAPSVIKTAGFIINGRLISIIITGPGVNQPNIISPVNNASNILATLTITANPFAVTSITDTHLSSDWQISTSSDFAIVVNSSTDDTVNKTSWTINGLSSNTIYYLRVRYKGTTYGLSAWSNTITVTTASVFIPSIEYGIVSETVKSAGNKFGYHFAVSGDGNTLVVGVPFKTISSISNAGCLYVYTKSGNSWINPVLLIGTDVASGTCINLGKVIAVNHDGSRIAAASGAVVDSSSPAATSTGSVYIFNNTSGTYTQEIKLIPDYVSTLPINMFGTSLKFKNDGTSLLIGDPIAVGSTPAVQNGAVFIYSLIANVWTKNVTLTLEFPVTIAGYSVTNSNKSGFGESITVNNAFTKIAVGFSNMDTTNPIGSIAAGAGNTNGGIVVIFNYNSSSVWVRETILTSPDLLIKTSSTGYHFGASLSFDATGDMLLVGQPSAWKYVNGANSPAPGTAFVFSNSNGIWNLESTLALGSTAQTYEKHGWSVSINSLGTLAAVSAPDLTVNNLTKAGTVFLFRKINGVWTKINTLTASISNINDNYGYHLALTKDGSTLLISAPNSDQSATIDSGAIYNIK